MKFIIAIFLATLAAVQSAPTNDVTLYIRALYVSRELYPRTLFPHNTHRYQNCTDSNNDTLAVKFLEGNEKFVASHSLSRNAARDALATFSDHNVVYFSSRTNYIDEFIASSLKRDPTISQIVVVAAGFDSRAYRIPFAGKYFELDMPEVIEAKKAKVAENGLKTVGQSVTYVVSLAHHITLEHTQTLNTGTSVQIFVTSLQKMLLLRNPILIVMLEPSTLWRD